LRAILGHTSRENTMTIGVNSAAQIQTSQSLADLNSLYAEPNIGSPGTANQPNATTKVSSDSVVLDAATPPADQAALLKFIRTLNQSASVGDAARGSGQAVLSLLDAVKSAATTAADPSTTDADRAALQNKVQTYLGQIQHVVKSAGFNGVNLLDNSQPGGVAIGQGLSLSPQDLTLGGANIPLTSAASVANAGDASATLANVDAAIRQVGSALKSLDGQISGVQDLTSQLSGLAGLGGAAPPSDVSGDGARLLALQVSQGVSDAAAAIASGSQLGVLSLFR
jgi:flagellin